MSKKYQTNLVFGSDKKSMFNNLTTKKEKLEFLTENQETYSFNSSQELEAFQKGILTAVGYLEVYDINDFDI